MVKCEGEDLPDHHNQGAKPAEELEEAIPVPSYLSGLQTWTDLEHYASINFYALKLIHVIHS